MTIPDPDRPYSATERQAIDHVGKQVDADLAAHDVRLTQGSEPTFVAASDRDAPEWNHAALGTRKRALAEALLARLQACWAPGGLMLSGQGKLYPGESLPRWALGLFWRADGFPIWHDLRLNALHADAPPCGIDEARRFVTALVETLGLNPACVTPAYEDPWFAVNEESRLPINVDPFAADLGDATQRARLARLLRQGLNVPAGYVLPLTPARGGNGPAPSGWTNSAWPLRRERLYLVPGDSAIGYRLPLDTLPATDRDPDQVVRTAVCVEPRQGRLYVFLPPLERLEDYLDLVAAVERTAAGTGLPVVPDGHDPPADSRVNVLKVTPDPGVVEVNLHPAADWAQLSANMWALYEEARQIGLSAEKYLFDGRRVGTGGGCHITLGGPAPMDSPLLRRPDLVQSLVTYWQNHPALSYLFAGLFIGPTSQAPRIDEAREDALYELEIAFQRLARGAAQSGASRGVDPMLRHLLVDVTGNTHRAEFCIDKLDSADAATGQLGLLELRAFEMAPHPDMSLVQALLVRALVTCFWRTPYRAGLVRWGNALHDRFMLPHFLTFDLHEVVSDLRRAGYAFEFDWFDPFCEFRCPRIADVDCGGVRLALRHALEPWLVLSETAAAGATSRPVDSSLERLEVKVRGMDPTRHAVVCNGRRVPLHPTNVPGEFVAGVRFRAWQYPGALHPTIGVHAPLAFDVVDLQTDRALGGCNYHVMDPAGKPYDRRPADPREAAERRAAHIIVHGRSECAIVVREEPANPVFPLTLDLRYQIS